MGEIITDHSHYWSGDGYADGCSNKDFSDVSTPEGWIRIASVDESESYETDISEIYKVGDKFALLNASGCSCWSGEWSAEIFDSLDDIERSLLTEDRQYQPSFKGAYFLLERAREALAKEV